MPIKVDDEIGKLYDEIKMLSGEKQATATLLLALKVGDLERAVIDVKMAAEGISQSLGIALDHDAEAIRTTSRPYAP